MNLSSFLDLSRDTCPTALCFQFFPLWKAEGQTAERSRVNLESRAELGKRGTELTWSQSQSSGWDRTSMELSGTQVLEGLWWERSLNGQLAWSLGTHFDCFKIGSRRGLERGLWVPSLSGWQSDRGKVEAMGEETEDKWANLTCSHGSS